MTRQQLEAAVLAAVDQLRMHHQQEDDRIEFKREWPGPEKARQLAGAANRASGSYLIYVIGVDERSGDVVPALGVDPADWWAQMEARFGQVAPELLMHLTVYLGDGSAVTALLFSTERAPYLVKTAGGSPELEIPIRDGTRTRSARRDEVLRLLVPAVSFPPAVLLGASLRGEHRLPLAQDDAAGSAPRRSRRTSVGALEYLSNTWVAQECYCRRMKCKGGSMPAFPSPMRYMYGRMLQIETGRQRDSGCLRGMMGLRLPDREHSRASFKLGLSTSWTWTRSGP